MNKTDRWLLPEGIEEVLPEEAKRLEHMRRQLLDTYENWGYDLVIPPFIEYLESATERYNALIHAYCLMDKHYLCDAQHK